MNLKTGRLFLIYFCLSSLFLMGIFGGAVYTAQQYNLTNFDSIGLVFESSSNLQKMEKDNYIVQIEELIENDKVKSANELLKNFEVLVSKLKMTSIDKKVEKKFFEELVTVKNKLNELAGVTELSTVLNVFSNKMEAFQVLSEGNNWKTLTRISTRINARISSNNQNKKGFFSFSRMKSLVVSINQDLNIMQSITESSVLSNENKDLINNRLQGLKTELLMISKCIGMHENINANIANLKTAYAAWLKEVRPLVTYQKIQLGETVGLFFMGLMVLLGVLFAGMMFGIAIFKIESKATQKRMENNILTTIENHLLPMDKVHLKGVSVEFQEKFDKTKDYLHKRMSFGMIFQEALPFASCLLDSNLNLIWGNKLFYETWRIDQNNANINSNLNWDHLQRFTNFGENDPIVAALKENVAGIFQVQVRTTINDEPMPYEMYVSPLEHASQKRIMIFLYPLRSLEETITHHTRSIVGPISKTIDSLGLGGFTQEFKEHIKKDFEVAGIEDIFDKFSKYNDFVTQQRLGLVGEIERLENELTDNFKIAKEAKNSAQEKQELELRMLKQLQETKNEIVKTLELRDSALSLFSETFASLDQVCNIEGILKDNCESLLSQIEENEKTFHKISLTKNDVKTIKNQLEDARLNIIQTLDQAMMFAQGDKKFDGITQALSKVKVEVRAFEKIMKTLNQSLVSFDVLLSKLDLLLSDSNLPDLTDVTNSFINEKNKLSERELEFARLMKDTERADESIIINIKEMYDLLKHQGIKLESMLSQLSKLSTEEADGIMNDAPPVFVDNKKSEISINNDMSIV